MEALQSILLAVHIIAAVLIVILVLLQPSSNDGGFVSNYANPNSFMTGKAASNLLQKITVYIVAIFMVNVLVLGVISNRQTEKDSVIDKVIEKVEEYEEQSSVPIGE